MEDGWVGWGGGSCIGGWGWVEEEITECAVSSVRVYRFF